tara:strand:- start:294 stop:1184 length:891 start_codon:yes stop_codon:yes gene_type:complete
MRKFNLMLLFIVLLCCLSPSADVQKIFNKAIDDLQKSEIMSQVLRTGSKAPDFQLFDQKGKKIQLSKLREKGPVVLTFYRGSWCSYCNEELKNLVKIMPKIEELGATLVAITPELSSGVQKTSRLIGSDFSLLSDVNGVVCKTFKVVYRLPDKVNDIYNQLGIDLGRANGGNSQSLPLAATYVIDREGMIRFDFVEADYKKRVDKAKLIASLQSLVSKKPNVKGLQQALLQMKEVHCGGCANTIKKRLMAVDGVKKVIVSFKTGKAKVIYSAQQANLEQIKKAVGKDFPIISAKNI